VFECRHPACQFWPGSLVILTSTQSWFKYQPSIQVRNTDYSCLAVVVALPPPPRSCTLHCSKIVMQETRLCTLQLSQTLHCDAGLICARDLIAMWCKSLVLCVQWLQHMLVCGVFATALWTASKGCLVVLSGCMAKQA